ncbi:hypothetical protein EDC04DRAFT_2865074 [Pisolithus marmoratus]|nr:hypothetical protein EDC04DRAFT_2865074 [Pisolithus marmoratus]
MIELQVIYPNHHCFWAAGVNDIWAVDQHDKWIHFGLALHTGIEPFSRKILWIHIWHSNRNPQLILTYFLDVVNELGSTLGSENYGIWHDPTLEGTLQHQWMMIFQWIFIPWLQAELNAYQDHVNHTAKWCNHNKVLPHGVPELIFSTPQDYGTLDLKFMVDRAALKHVYHLYINPSHPVFDLVPSPLNTHLEACYNNLGCPAVTCHTVWDIYLDLLHAVQYHALLQSDLPFNDMDGSYYYMGGGSGGLSLGE